jgi:hypothetical protein
MPATVGPLERYTLPGAAGPIEMLAVTVSQTNAVAAEEFTIGGLPVHCALTGYWTQTNLQGALTMRPELGTAAGFVYGAAVGNGLARYRRATEAVRSAAQVPLWLAAQGAPLGSLVVRPTFSRVVTAAETVWHRLLFTSLRPGAEVGTEPWGEWEIATLSTAANAAVTGTLGANLAAALATNPIDLNGTHQVELWLDFTDIGAGTNPSDVRIQWQIRDSSAGGWAPVLWEQAAAAAVAAGVATVPSYAYEVQDMLGNVTLPAGYPFTRQYVVPVRNWSGQLRALIYNNGAAATRGNVSAVLRSRGA